MPKSFSLRNLCGHCASAVSLRDKERFHRRDAEVAEGRKDLFRQTATGEAHIKGEQVREGDL